MDVVRSVDGASILDDWGFANLLQLSAVEGLLGHHSLTHLVWVGVDSHVHYRGVLVFIGWHLFRGVAALHNKVLEPIHALPLLSLGGGLDAKVTAGVEELKCFLVFLKSLFKLGLGGELRSLRSGLVLALDSATRVGDFDPLEGLVGSVRFNGTGHTIFNTLVWDVNHTTFQGPGELFSHLGFHLGDQEFCRHSGILLSYSGTGVSDVLLQDPLGLCQHLGSELELPEYGDELVCVLEAMHVTNHLDQHSGLVRPSEDSLQVLPGILTLFLLDRLRGGYRR